jgi:hypothetical protein
MSYSLCPTNNECKYTSHLICLAAASNTHILPHNIFCPSCGLEVSWGEVIRSCFGRREGIESEQVEAVKEKGKARRSRKVVAATAGDEPDDLLCTQLNQAEERSTPADSAERDQTAKSRRRFAQPSRVRKVPIKAAPPRSRVDDERHSESGSEEWEQFDREMRGIT